MIAFDLQKRYFYFPELSENDFDSNNITWSNPIDFNLILNAIGFSISNAEWINEGHRMYLLRVHHIPTSRSLEARGDSTVSVLNNLIQML